MGQCATIGAGLDCSGYWIVGGAVGKGARLRLWEELWFGKGGAVGLWAELWEMGAGLWGRGRGYG